MWTQVRVTLRKPGSKLEHQGLTAELIGDIGQCAFRLLNYNQPPQTNIMLYQTNSARITHSILLTVIIGYFRTSQSIVTVCAA